MTYSLSAQPKLVSCGNLKNLALSRLKRLETVISFFYSSLFRRKDI